MKPLYHLCLLALLCGLAACNTYKPYVHSGDYSIRMPDFFRTYTDKKENGYNDKFYFGSGPTDLQYLVQVLKEDSISATQEDLKKERFITEFEKNCSCDILNSKEQRFGGRRYQVVTFKVYRDEQLWMGYSMNTIYKNSYYTIDLMTPQGRFNQYKALFRKITRSFKALGR